MSQFPMPPADLSQVPTWIMSVGFLIALVTLLLKIPQVAALDNWKKAALSLAVVTVVGEVMVALSGYLTPELLAKLQPYWAQFLIGLGAIAAVYGIQFAYRVVNDGVVKPIKLWWSYRQALMASRIATITNQPVKENHVERFVFARKA